MITVAAAAPVWAQSYTVLADFGEQAEGWSPKGSLLKASDGNFYGTTEQGGAGHGTIFRLTPGGAFTTVFRFRASGADGGSPTPDLIESGGLLYGTTQGGGNYPYGTIFEFDPATGTLTTLHAFDHASGAYPRSGLVQGSDGNLYGTTQSGGANGLGALYRWSPGATPAVSRLHSFGTFVDGSYVDGYYPMAGLVEHSPGVFYGTAPSGGTGGGYGTIFKFTAATGEVVAVHPFTYYDGYQPVARLTKGTDGKLYGVTPYGGGIGTIFAFDPAAATPFTLLHTFTGSDGSSPYAHLTLAGDGSFQGTTIYGGAGYGVVFRYAPGAGSPFSVLHSFSSADGAHPHGAIVEKSAGTFLGTTSASGSAGHSGTIFQLTTTGSPALSTLHEFEGSPAEPDSPLVQAADGSFYGVSSGGGTHASGTLFKVDPAGVITTLVSFGGGIAAYTPSGDLVFDEAAGTIIGTTQSGGSGCGTIYKFDLAAGSLTIEHEFACSDGRQPHGGLIRGSDGFLYGTSLYGGTSVYGIGFGTVFRWNPDPAAPSPRLQVLKEFTVDSTGSAYPDGALPYAGLVEGTPGTFYGTTHQGGASNAGVIFSITSAGVFTKLHEFVYDPALGWLTGFNPVAGLAKGADGHLYGTTNDTVFRLTVSGTLTVLDRIEHWVEGQYLEARLAAAGDGTFYGSARYYGPRAGGAGTLFRLDPAAGAVTVVHSYGTDPASGLLPEGGYPRRAMMLGADGLLYGTTPAGGRGGRGVVFRLDPPPIVRVLRANGGETLYTGTPYVVQWTAADNNPLDSFEVFFSADAGATYGSTPICTAAGSARSCTWAAPVETPDGRFRVVARDSAGGTMSDESDGSFTVVAGAGAVTVTSPTTAVTWNIGSAQTITWTHNLGSASHVTVALSRDGGATFTALATDIPNTGSLGWTVTSPATTQARVKVTWTNGPTVTDMSDVNFTIAGVTGPSCCITVTQPTKTKLEYGIGSTQQIKWTHNLGAGTSVKIELSRDGGSTYPEVIAASVANSSATAGSYNWVVTGPNTALARVRVTAVVGTAADASDNHFKIAPAYVKLSGFTASTSWGYGTAQNVGWTTNLGPLDKVTVQLSQDGGATFANVANNVVATKKKATATTPTLTTAIATARVRVLWNNPPSGFSAADTSANFKIEPPFVLVVAPNGGEVWAAGTKPKFLWSSNLGALEKVNITLSKDSGATFPTAIVSNTPSDGSQAVAISSAWATTTGRVRLVWVKNPAVADVSNADFTITP